MLLLKIQTKYVRRLSVIHSIWGILFLLSQAACKKFVTVAPPVTSLTGADVYNSDPTAAAVLTNIYTNMSQCGLPDGRLPSLSFYLGLCSDELTLYTGVSNTTYIGYYTNALTINNISGADFWSNIYGAVYVPNAALEGLSQSSGLTTSVKQQLVGEAKFLRALYYFYLANLYGDVPLVTSTAYQKNTLLPRSPNKQVWNQIIADLKDAQSMLSSEYLDGSLLNTTTERVRPTKWAATALLARSYLYTRDWTDAENQASVLIDSGAALYSLSSLDSVFLKNNPEAIWQLQPVNAGQNTLDALGFILPSSGPDVQTFVSYLSPCLLSAFEAKDKRRVHWIDSVNANGTTYYYPFKYKVNTLNAPVIEYRMILRLGEQYLIRAEARVNQGNISGAANDLNIIRYRAGLPNTAATTTQELQTAIWHERQVELFTEWGQRWLDLKRTSQVNAVMDSVTLQKGGSWSSYKQLFPVSLYELQNDPNLAETSGY